MTRRSAISLLAASPAILRTRATAAPALEIAKGKFAGTRDSLRDYQPPAWFRDAKFGIWAHWGPQSAPEAGDWYARNMYIQGHAQYKYHVEHYGHPSKFGFKDVIPTWKGDKFDAEHLISLYKKAGAKYFVSMGVHHDNFDMWNSKHNKWNSVQMGAKKDIVGMFHKAALKHGLRFGVSDHLWISYKWFATSHGTDKSGPMAGVAYDGADAKFADLYHDANCEQFATGKLGWNADGIPEEWKMHWFQRIKDLVDAYQPDLLYNDGALPFEEYGCHQVANLYNLSAKRHGGETQAVYTTKQREDCETGTCVLDIERGLVDKIWPNAWQTDTCLGDWHYRRGVKYKTAKTVVDLLCDIVSRNGNLLLNVPLPNSGMPDPEELAVVEDITKWMAVNSEGIYATRPWKIFGGSTEQDAQGSFNEKKRKALTADDVRFTSKGNTIYAFVMGWPEKQASVRALGTASAQAPGKIVNVELLGHKGKVKWTQAAEALTVAMPAEKPSDHAVTLKVTTA